MQIFNREAQKDNISTREGIAAKLLVRPGVKQPERCTEMFEFVSIPQFVIFPALFDAGCIVVEDGRGVVG